MKMKISLKLVRLAAIAACAGFASGTAFADDNKDKPDGAGKERPSREEMRAKMLAKFDEDGDGKLSEAERAEARKAHGGKGGPGGPGKGRPSREMILKKFDKDGDGMLNDAEKAELKKAMAERRKEGGPGKRGPKGKGRPGGKGKGPKGGGDDS